MNPDNNFPASNQQPSGDPFRPGSVYGPPGPSPQNQPPKLPEPGSYNNRDSKKTKKIIAVAGILIGIFIIVAAVAIVARSGSNKPQPVVQEDTSARDLYTDPTAIQIENLNNSVSDDVTNLSTDTDFPSDKLSDDNLDL